MKIVDKNNVLEATRDSLLEELDQNAANPELKPAKELENLATDGEKPEEKAPEVDNKDVYCDEVHDQTEEVKQVVVENKITEDGLEQDPNIKTAKDAGVADDKPAEVGNTIEIASDDETDEATEELIADVDSTISAESDEPAESEEIEMTESMKSLFDLINIINESVESQTAAGPELKPAEELKNEATKEKEAETKAEKIDNTDLFCDEVHDQVEDVEPIVVKEEESQVAAGPELEVGKELKNEATEEKKPEEDTLEKDNKDVFCDACHDQVEDVEQVEIKESDQLAAGPELKEPKELDNEATVESEPKEDNLEKDNKDVFCDEVHDQVEDVEPAVVKEEESQLAAGPELKPAEELKNEATEEKKPEEDNLEKGNTDVYCDACHDQVEDVEQVEIKESDQLAAGPELKPAEELKNEATEEKEPEGMKPEVDNKDVFPEDEHKQAEEVIEIVVEGARRCKSKGKPATITNICEEVGTDLAAKIYDVDKVIASPEAAEIGTEENEKHIEDADVESIVEPEDIMKESVNYTSIKDACLLEDYFTEDTYKVETAAEKTAKLTEQVSLILAREAVDPLYDELLRTSLYAQRLQESLVNKYKTEAEKRTNLITEKN